MYSQKYKKNFILNGHEHIKDFEINNTSRLLKKYILYIKIDFSITEAGNSKATRLTIR